VAICFLPDPREAKAVAGLSTMPQLKLRDSADDSRRWRSPEVIPDAGLLRDSGDQGALAIDRFRRIANFLTPG
jgi:hypothetical protein